MCSRELPRRQQSLANRQEFLKRFRPSEDVGGAPTIRLGQEGYMPRYHHDLDYDRIVILPAANGWILRVPIREPADQVDPLEEELAEECLMRGLRRSSLRPMTRELVFQKDDYAALLDVLGNELRLMGSEPE
jgi:hypothetical protein